MTSQTQSVPPTAARPATARRGFLGRALAPYLVEPADRRRARAVSTFPATRGASPAVPSQLQDLRVR